MIRIRTFLSEEGVSFFKEMSNEEIKDFIKKAAYGENTREIIGMPEGDIDSLLEVFREDNFIEYHRRTEWSGAYTKVLFNNGTVEDLHTKRAEFAVVNKWKVEGYRQKYSIIPDNSKKILWAGIHNEGKYFISTGYELCEISYEHKKLFISTGIGFENIYFNETNCDIIDNFIKKNSKSMRTICYRTMNKVKEISRKEKVNSNVYLDEYFEKGFFYKGFKWNKTWKDFHGHDYITRLNSITVKDGLFCIEIENLTYPFHGYVLLDLDKLEIVEAKKC